MEAPITSYGDTSSDLESKPPRPSKPPPLSLLNPTNSIRALDCFRGDQAGSSSVRTFPHVEGNYALYVYIPVYIPHAPKKELALFLKKVARSVPGLFVNDPNVPLYTLCNDGDKLEKTVLGRKLHISLGRTVPIRLHQIDTVVTMLRHKLQLQRRYWIDFSKWEIFVNDDCTRTFLSMEVVVAGLAEIRKQIQAVNEVYKLHNLPEFYEDPRPHISLAWASGDISNSLKNAIQQERRLSVGGSIQKCFFSCKFSGIDCKIGNRIYKICKFLDK